MNIKCDTNTFTNTRKTKGCVAIFFTHRSVVSWVCEWDGRGGGRETAIAIATARAYPCAIMGLWPINALTCNDFRLNLSFFGGSSHFIHLRPHVRVCNDICTHEYKHSLPPPLCPCRPFSPYAHVFVAAGVRKQKRNGTTGQQHGTICKTKPSSNVVSSFYYFYSAWTTLFCFLKGVIFAFLLGTTNHFQLARKESS